VGAIKSSGGTRVVVESTRSAIIDAIQHLELRGIEVAVARFSPGVDAAALP